MSNLFIKMAQAAADDKSLFASYIQQYASKKSLSWEEVADRLQITEEQLAKLALCNRPQATLFAGSIMQVADYVGMERAMLHEFVAESEGRQSVPQNQAPRHLEVASPSPLSRSKIDVTAVLFRQRAWVAGAVALLILLFGAFVLAQPASAAAATLVVTEGQATVVQTAVLASQREVVVAAQEILTVGTGDEIILTADASAQLRLIDGSTVDLAANTRIDVTELVIDDDSYQVRLKMLAGRTVSRVVTVLGVGDRFEISTPSSTASVRGTVFTVEVISTDETFVACDEGKVQVTLEGDSVAVEAGMAVTAVVGQPLEVRPQTPVTPPVTVPDQVPAGPQTPDVAAPEEDVPVETEPADEGALYEELFNRPEDIPGRDDLLLPGGPPTQVPGHTPDDTPGVGAPPDGEGDGPANDNGNNGNGGPPDQVPGNTPEETSGSGTPPTGGAEQPPGEGLDNNPNNNSGGNSSNEGGNNNSGGNSNSDNGGKKDK